MDKGSTLWELLIFLILIYFSIEDIKKREIDDRLVYITFALSVLLGVWKDGFLLSLLTTTIVAVLLYIMGAMALGDVWVLMVMAAAFPYTLLGVPLALWSLFIGSMLAFLWGVFKIIRNTWKDFVKSVLDAIIVAAPFSFHFAAGLLSIIFLERKFYPIFYVIALLSGNFNPVFVVSFVVFYVVLYLFKNRTLLTEEVEVKEGIIPGEIIDEKGERHPLNDLFKGVKPVHSVGADGLTQEDVKRLKSLGIHKIKAKMSLPFIPFLTLGILFAFALFIMCGNGLCLA